MSSGPSGVFHSGGPQHRGMRTAADDGLHVEFLAERPGDHRVLFDHDDVVVFRAKTLSEVPADLSGSDDHDMHSHPACPMRAVFAATGG